MLNKLQIKFNQIVTSALDTLSFSFMDYSSGPDKSFTAGLVLYLDANEITLPYFEGFDFNTVNHIDYKTYDVPYILNILIPARMGRFYYHDK